MLFYKSGIKESNPGFSTEYLGVYKKAGQASFEQGQFIHSNSPSAYHSMLQHLLSIFACTNETLCQLYNCEHRLEQLSKCRKLMMHDSIGSILSTVQLLQCGVVNIPAGECIGVHALGTHLAVCLQGTVNH